MGFKNLRKKRRGSHVGRKEGERKEEERKLRDRGRERSGII